MENEADSDLCVALRGVLDGYPGLAARLPANYPHGLVTVDRMKAFEGERKKATGHWHLLNLPFVLHMARLEDHADGRDLACSLLQTLDAFCTKFGSLPGFEGVMKPLRTAAWKGDDPEFWSVIANAQTSLLLHSKGFTIKSFAEKLPAETTKDADIFVETPEGHGIYLDLVMKHRPKFTTAEEARAELTLHADEKVGNKFAPVLAAKVPVMVLVIVVAHEKQLKVLLDNPSVLKTLAGPELDRREGIAACFHALIGNRGSDGRLAWHLAALDELVATQAQPNAQQT